MKNASIWQSVRSGKDLHEHHGEEDNDDDHLMMMMIIFIVTPCASYTLIFASFDTNYRYGKPWVDRL
jgi:heme/copper-type cytochrome/quinol oxidase subunit 3